MKKLLSMLLLFAAVFSVSMAATSCGDDDDGPAMAFERQSVIGTWTITSVNGTSFPSFTSGSALTFNGDGTCETAGDMETAWRIEGGKIYTYYAKTDEPMYVYTLLSKSGDTMSVRVTGTLDESHLSITISMHRTN